MLHHRLRLLSIMLVLALIAAACEQPADPEADPDEDDYAFTWAVLGDPGHEAVADLWNEQNPDRQVRYEALPPEADDQRTALFNDQVTDAGRYDVLGLDVVWTGEFADAGFLVSLEDQREDISDGPFDAALETAQWQEELWAAPFTSGFGLLYYRTDLMDEPPETWAELVEIVETVQAEQDIDGYVGQGDSYEGFVVNYLEMLWSADGQVFSEDQTESLLLEGDAAEEAATFMREAFRDGIFAGDFNTMVEDDGRVAFQTGDAIFMRNWPYAYGLLRGEDEELASDVADDFDVAPLPTFDGEGTTSALGGLNNAVSALSDNQEVATEFVTWAATSKEVQELLTEHPPLPVGEHVYERWDEIVPEDEQRIYEVLDEVIDSASARPPVPGYNSFSLAVQDELHPAIMSDDDLDAALQAVDQAAEDALVEEVDPEAEADEADADD